MDGVIKLTDLIPDDQNANLGTYIGEKLLDTSFEKFGAGRSILIDKYNNIIAGNKSTTAALENGIDEAIVVETTGEKLVVVKRTDIDLNTKEGREMAIADNGISKQNLRWDKVALTQIEERWGSDPKDWGVEIEKFEAEEYKPNLNPVQGDYETTGEDIEKAKNKIKEKIDTHRVPQNLMEVCCPECGYIFEIKRY